MREDTYINTHADAHTQSSLRHKRLKKIYGETYTHTNMDTKEDIDCRR